MMMKLIGLTKSWRCICYWSNWTSWYYWKLSSRWLCKWLSKLV